MTVLQDRPAANQNELTPVGHALPHSPRSASLARAIVRDALTGLSLSTVETAQLLADELVTNAVLHARSMLVLHITVAEHRLRIGVEDLSFDYPLPQQPSADAEDGHGLVLLDALASAWGWDQTPVGKHTWFELPTGGTPIPGHIGSSRTGVNRIASRPAGHLADHPADYRTVPGSE
jgi:anti-sigma regulatory factor (Ser/Thr protein kinase)